jgi:hypothetical protein
VSRRFLPLPVARSHPSLVADVCPELELVQIQRFAFAAACHDQHSGGDQLKTRVYGRPGTLCARLAPGGLGQDVVAASRHLAELSEGVGMVAALGGGPHSGAVQVDRE